MLDLFNILLGTNLKVSFFNINEVENETNNNFVHM